MSEPHRASLALAQRVADELTVDSNVRAMIVTGSVALGAVDQHSDIDIIIFLAQPATDEFFDRQKSIATDSGGGVYGGSPEEGFGVYRVIDGTKVDLGFSLVSKTDELINDVLVDHDLDSDKQLIIRGIRQGIPLCGETVIAKWVAATDTYPDALLESVIKANIRVRPIWVLRGMGADRNDRPFLTEEILTIQRQMLSILAALNREYHPGKLKGVRAFAHTLAIAPPNLYERLEAMLTDDLHPAVDEVERMVNEVFALIDQHAPHIDTDAARSFFALNMGRRNDQ